MARNLEALQRQLSILQQKVDAAKAKEAIGVIERIKTAIEFYGLTPEDLFGSKPAVSRPTKPVVEKKKGGRVPGSTSSTSGANRALTNAKPRTGASKKPALPPKYQDDLGNGWSGHGKRPNWFKALIENGKTPEELLVKVTANEG